MQIFGLTGWSGSGKTELILRLIKHFNQKNMRTSIVKHAHHSFNIDTPGKDSFRYRENGCVDAMVSSSERWALMHENKNEDEPNLQFLISQMQPVDLILVEGFKHETHPKIEIWRKALQQEPLALNPKLKILAIASEDEVPYKTLPLDNTKIIADFILQNALPAKEWRS